MNELTFETVKTIVSEVLTSRNYSQSSIQSLTRIMKRFNDYLESRKIPDYRDVRESELTDLWNTLRKALKEVSKRKPSRTMLWP